MKAIKNDGLYLPNFTKMSSIQGNISHHLCHHAISIILLVFWITRAIHWYWQKSYKWL